MHQPKKTRLNRGSAGYSVLELLLVLGLVGIMSMVIANNMKQLSDPVQDSANQLMGFLKQARAKAISTTSAYIVEADGASRLVTRYDTTCGGTTSIADPQLSLDLADGVTMDNTTFSVCFTSRGLPDTDLTLTVSTATKSRTVELFLGGAIRIQ